MGFPEEAAELHELEALALCLGLTEAMFVAIAQAVTMDAHAAGGAAPSAQLAEIRRRIHSAARPGHNADIGPR